MKKLLGLVFNRWTIGALGLIALSLLIWFVGPMVRVGDYTPLGEEWPRWVLIAVIVAIYLIKAIIGLVRAARSNTALLEGLARSSVPKPAADGSRAGAEEIALLEKRFQDAINVLKRARFGDRSRGASLSAFAGKQYLYELPWYMIIGAPGSGKTTALLNAGLEFPLSERMGKDAIRGVGGTRNCDWWFTSDAVLIDTAGRYTTQDSNRTTDEAAWASVLDLLKKHRPRRPINGVLLAISAQDLLTQNAGQRETHATQLRARIQELHERIGIRFPIYVLVTKTDLLAGFNEFFAELGQEDRAQVWGVTFDFEAGAGEVPIATVPQELHALESRLNARLVTRMQAERDLQRRAALYAFPQQFSALRETLGDFLRMVFAPSPYEERPLVRGVYFTSGTQEGSPIDRIIGATGRALGLARRTLAATRGSGRSYFLSRLLSEVIFNEAGLAGTNLKWERRRTLAHWGALVAAVLVTSLAVLAWGISYTRNRAYVADVRVRVAEIAKHVQAIPAEGTDVAALLPLLQSVRDLASAAPVPGSAVPWSLGFGLYQGEKLGQASRTAYERLLRDAMLPRLSARIEQLLVNDGQANPELFYEALKTYVMLHDAKRFDRDAVKAFIAEDWETSLPPTLTADHRGELASHLDRLLSDGRIVSHRGPKDALLARARATVAQTPLSVRAYNRLKRLGVGSDYPEFTIAKEGGPGASLVLYRASGQALTKGIAGIFTYNAYHKALRGGIDKVAGQLADESEWVMGEPASRSNAALPGSAGDRLAADVERLYLEDYARVWDGFVRDIRVIRPTDLQKSLNVTQVLASATDTPIPRLFRAIVREVTLGQIPEAEKSAIDKGVDKVREKADDLKRLLRGNSGGPQRQAARPSQVEQIVDTRFDHLRRMVTPPTPGAKAPIDDTTALMGDINTWLVAADTALKQKLPPPPGDPVVNKARVEAGRIPEPLNSMITALVADVARIVTGVARGRIGENLREISAQCRKFIDGRYPFVADARDEVQLEDFAALFAPGGKLDQFFKSELEAIVDQSGREWIFKPALGATAGTPSRALAQFRRARVIREVFFRGGGTAPSIRLDFAPGQMDATIQNFILDADGSIVRYSHGPAMSTTVQWPGAGGRKQVRIEISPPSPSGNTGLSHQGAWALFRLLERSQMQPGAQPERFAVTFSIEGRKAQFDVSTSSVQNPFGLRELREFRCPDAE